jgi:SAM-dependent methyltransferase
MNRWIALLARRFLPITTRRKIIRLTRWPPVGLVRWGSLRRLKPVSEHWGMERGLPIDRYYIERFLDEHRGDIQGSVLEIGDNNYTRQFGGEKVTESVVLHVAEQKEHVTLIGDLTDETTIPENRFDCVIITQTLQTIYDLKAAVKNIYRSLKPGGVALVTVPGISKISRYDMDRWGYYWSFTTQSAQKLFEGTFTLSNVFVNAYGNVLTSIAFLHGLSVEELNRRELDHLDPDYELLITVKAEKQAQS